MLTLHTPSCGTTIIIDDIGDIRPEASVPKPLLKPPPNPRPPSFPGDPVSIEPSTPSRVAVNPSTAAQPPSFGQASPHYNSSSPQPAPPPKHRERPPPLQAPPGASATRTLPPVAGIHSPPQPGASPNHLHRVPSFDPDASGVEPPAAQAGGNTTGGFVRVMSHEINQALQASRGRGSSAGVVRSLSHDLQRNSPHQRNSSIALICFIVAIIYSNLCSFYFRSFANATRCEAGGPDQRAPLGRLRRAASQSRWPFRACTDHPSNLSA